MTETIHFVNCWVDGGVIGHNPSPRGVYWSALIELGKGHRPVMIRKRTHRYRTNNEAEYLALREALMWLVARNVRFPVIIHSDSKLIVNQFNGRFMCNVPGLIKLRDECREWAEKQGKIILRMVSVRGEQPRMTMVRKLGH